MKSQSYPILSLDIYVSSFRTIVNQALEESETWDDLMKDIERVIMPGITHWHSPHFHAYFPTSNSYPAICADILSDAIACIGFSWVNLIINLIIY